MTPSDLSPADQLAATRALAALAAAAGSQVSIDSEVPLDPPGDGEVPLDALDWLVLAAGDRGLPLEVIEADIAEVPEWLRRDVPLIGLVESSTEAGRLRRWVVLSLSGPDRADVWVEGPEGVETWPSTFGALADDLGCKPGARMRWAVASSKLAQPTGLGSSNGTKLHPLNRLGQLLQPDRSDLFAVSVFAVVVGVLLLATPIAVQAVVNFVALGGATAPLFVVVALLFLGLLLANMLIAFQTWTVEILQRRLFVRSVAELSARLPRVALDRGDTKYGPELVNRYFDLQTIQKQGAFLLLEGLALVLSVLTGLLLLAFYHPYLLVFDIIIVSAMVIVVLGPIRRGIKSAKAESSAKYEMAAWLEEIAANPKLFKSSGVMKSVFERSDRLARRYVEARRRHFRIVFTQGIAALLLQVGASTALLGIGGYLVIAGEVTLGQLVAAEIVLATVLSSLAKLGKQLEAFYDLMAATDKLGMVLDVPLERSNGEHHFTPEARGAELEMRGVAWATPGGGALFSNVTFTAGRGERIGIRGPSGAGKSVLLELAWGLRSPSAGNIRVDGRDLRELTLESLRRSVALVDGIDVIDATVRENVLMARPFVSDDKVREALQRVDLLDHLSSLPDGLETRLGVDGGPLSLGQLAELQLARAIAAEPRLLLVSDVFPILDPSERGRLFDVLFDRDAPWTLVFITNSEDALSRCDRTFVFENGSLVPDQTATAAS